jgi:hypothetical protein
LLVYRRQKVMRVIKFRQAIFTRGGQFHSWHYWGFLHEGVSVSPELNSSTHKEAQERSQQFTRLTDCDGHEIYEGDILLWNSSGVKGTWVVKTVDGGWDPFIAHMQTDGAWHYKVIGNIYENPELLNGR